MTSHPFVAALTLLFSLFIYLPSAYAQAPIELRSNFWTGTGYYQADTRLSKTQVREALAVDPEALQLFKAGAGQKGLGDVLAVAGGALIGWPLGTAIGGGDPNWTLAAIGAGIVVVAIPIYNGGIKKINQGLDRYNQGLSGLPSASESNYSLSVVNSNDGIGVRLHF